MAHLLKVLFLPAVRTHWGEGLIQIRVMGNPISSTLNGLKLRAASFPLLLMAKQITFFHEEPVINPYWLSSDHQKT